MNIFSHVIAPGKTLVLEFGELAQQADGAVLAKMGDTVVLGTACMNRKADDIDFLPLNINFQEKLYAAGRLHHSKVNKREARPSDANILTGRVIDRTLRPLFPKDFHNPVQGMATLLSYDNEADIDVLATIALSAAFSVSPLPLSTPAAMVKVGRIQGEFVINPTQEEAKISDIDLSVSCTSKAVIMIEASAHIIDEQTMMQALEFGFEHGKKICEFLSDVAQKIGKNKIECVKKVYDSRIEPALIERYREQVYATIFNESLSKRERFALFDDLKQEAVEALVAEFGEGELNPKDIVSVMDSMIKNTLRNAILHEKRRIKGRGIDEIRPLSSRVDILPRTHGSALFNRGETQALSVVTLAGPSERLVKTGVIGEEKHRYFHHYNFPPFSVGEVSHRLYTGNREIGHGALAEKALIPVLPSEEVFPYTIRVVTEILSSNGSSSMASACGSSLALMAAGVPLLDPVSGIALGLITDEKGNFEVLVDLQDEEDFGGDMDFKVAGTKNGITAIQMDVKIPGISFEVFRVAFEKAKKARLTILESMNACIASAKPSLSPYAPRLESVQIPLDKIKVLIGKGGENINKIIDATKVSIDIDESGLVVVTSLPGSDMERALFMIKQSTFTPEVNQVYSGEVVKIMDFGVFVRIAPGVEGLVHISQMSQERIPHPSALVQEGQKIDVLLMSIDAQGRNNFKLITIHSL